MVELSAPDACPAAELLAALAEGRLRGRERDQLLPHLRRCQDCFQSYSLALGVLAEAGSAPARWRPRVLAWGSLAAAALLFLALRLVTAPGPPDTAPPRPNRAAPVSLFDLARDARQAHVSAESTAPFEAWPATAPAGHAFAADDDTRALRLWGVRLADLEWSAHFAPAAVDDAAARLRAVLDGRADASAARAALASREAGSAMAIEPLFPSAAEAREAAALGWLLEWCRLSSRAGRFELCPAAQPAAAAALARALDDPAARRLWSDVLRCTERGHPAVGAERERALRRLLEVLT